LAKSILNSKNVKKECISRLVVSENLNTSSSDCINALIPVPFFAKTSSNVAFLLSPD
jgi:hypothetical protein